MKEFLAERKLRVGFVLKKGMRNRRWLPPKGLPESRVLKCDCLGCSVFQSYASFFFFFVDLYIFLCSPSLPLALHSQTKETRVRKGVQV